MRWRISRVVAPALAGLVACGGGERADTGFADVAEVSPTPVMVLRSDSSHTDEGHRVAELDVLMPGATDEAIARVTLQHVIDSVAAVDTLAAAVRVTGFVMGELDRATSSADLFPAMRATWGPIDSAGYTGSRRRSRYRTDYVVLRPFGTPGTTEQRR
jgi:hypothetical protein